MRSVEPLTVAKVDDETATAAGYDRWAASYDDRDPSTWLDEPFLLKHLQPFPGCSILDLGCGTGRYLRRLTASTFRITGLDLSRKMLRRARQEMGTRSDITLVQASVSCLPFQPHTFDRIMSGLLVDHIDSAGQWFQEMSAVLRPNGRAVVAAVHPDMQRLTGQQIEIVDEDAGAISIPGHVHEVEQLLAAAQNAGMAPIAIEEPVVTEAMLAHRPAWKRKVGCRALLLLALVAREHARSAA